VIYAAYYDESNEKPGFSLAGYAAPYQTWIHLDWTWRELLKKWKLAYFKASECENLFGECSQYRDHPTDLKSALNPNERSRLIEIKTDFVDAICKHSDDLQGYGAVVVVDDFERIVSEDTSARELLMDKPYYICFQLCLVAAAMPARDFNLRQPKENHVYVKPIFDSHEEYSGLAKRLFDRFLEGNPRSAEVLLPPDFEDDKVVSALQVADTLCYEARKHLTRKIANPQDEYIRKPLERLRPFVYRIYKLDYQALKLIVARQGSDYIPISPVKMEELW
jgi:hypothetical protein